MPTNKPLEPEALRQNQTQPKSSFRPGQSQSFIFKKFPVRGVPKPYPIGDHTLAAFKMRPHTTGSGQLY